ncbi:hypothetical protein HY490_03315 [Candidatus Woesearchaeota archaeon]|nr:hypothetical protein [Candidatus Woesearchaeota archaeon]
MQIPNLCLSALVQEFAEKKPFCLAQSVGQLTLTQSREDKSMKHEKKRDGTIRLRVREFISGVIIDLKDKKEEEIISLSM